MKTYTKIATIGLSSLLFFGCSAQDDVEYVRVTQFESLEKKIEILETNTSKMEEEYKKMKDEVAAKQKENTDKDLKVELLQQELTKLKSDMEKIEISLERKISSEDLKNAASEKKIVTTDSELLEKKLKTSTLGESKSINLDEETQAAAEKNMTLTKDTVIYFDSEESANGKDFLVFSFCEGEKKCPQYLFQKDFFTTMNMPKIKGQPFIFSGQVTSLGTMKDKEYLMVEEGFKLETEKSTKKPTTDPEKIIIPDGSPMDKISE